MSSTNPWEGSNTVGGKLGPVPASDPQGSGNGGGNSDNPPKPGHLTVTVKEALPPNKALSGIKVEAIGPQPDKTAAKATTNSAGVASFPSLKPGNYHITVKGPKHITEYADSGVSSDHTTNTPVALRPARQLKMTFYEHIGDKHPSIYYEFWVGGVKVFEENSVMGKLEVPFTDKNNDSTIDENITEATLVIRLKRGGVWHGKAQKIQLHFDQPLELKAPTGGVDPSALQRLLTNLGYEPGAVDGAWSGPTQAALRAFQADMKLPVTSIPDSKTTGKLIDSCEIPVPKSMKNPKSGDGTYTGGDDPDVAPALGEPLKLGAFQWYEKGSMWDQYEGYIDRTAPAFASPATHAAPAPGAYKIERGDETAVKLFDPTPGTGPEDASFEGVLDAAKQKPRFFPTEVFVSLAEKGDDTWKNAVWMLKYRSMFLDCGGWVNKQRNFGLIVGWHAYLCDFVPPEEQVATVRATPIAPKSGNPRLDHDFFTAMGDAVTVTKVGSAVWGKKDEFTWDKAILIFPDFHLMTAIAGNCWKANNSDQGGEFYDMGAEIDFFNFAQQIVAEPKLRGKLQIIQLGDTYDLWVGSPAVLGHNDPLFEGNKCSLMKLRAPAKIRLPSGQNYGAAAGKKEILERWDGCVDQSTDVSGMEMHIQVLKWWMEAIQGHRDSPLEVQYARVKPRAALDEVNTLLHQYDAGQILGSGVAKTIKEKWSDLYDGLPDQPTIMIGTGAYIGSEPETGRVLAWLKYSRETLEGRIAPPLMNWVQWTLSRREKSNDVSLAGLTDIDRRYRGGEMSGKEVAKAIKEHWPDIYETLPDSPGMVMVMQPGKDRVFGWMAHVANHLTQYDASVKSFAKYVKDHLGGRWLNPSEAGMEILKAAFGGMEIIYGNHDDYLILPEVVAGTTQGRKRYLEYKGVFIEHAHRIEPLLAVGSANYDGCVDGFDLTNNVWRSKFRSRFSGEKDDAGRAGKIKDYAIHHGEFMDPAVVPLSQVTYKNEAGRFLVGRAVERKQMPHIFVIGHTHGPIMHLNYVHLNDLTDHKGLGNLKND